MNLAATVEIYAGGPGSGCNPEKGKCGRKPGTGVAQVVSGKWNPEARLVYHWTDEEGIQGIIESGQWDGGSATWNPAYRFTKGVPKETRFALVFDAGARGFKTRKDPTVPWKEWEVLHDDAVDLFDTEKFLGFGVRDKSSGKRIRSLLKEKYDDSNMFVVHRVAKKSKGKLRESTRAAGEPSAGYPYYAHLDVRPTFHPPSLKKPRRVPADQPGEKDDRFLDVTKRKSREVERDRLRLARRNANLPALRPDGTTDVRGIPLWLMRTR